MDINTRGLVLREVAYKEADKILTVLTEDMGKVTVSARGARRKSSKYLAASQLLTFSEMNLYERQGRWYLREARTVELFDGLRRDIVLLALGSYFAELLEAVSDEDFTEPDILSLGLNSLYVLAKGAREPSLVKAAFELRLMCLAGYAPDLYACGICKNELPAEPRFNVNGGYIHCRTCRPDGQGVSVPLDEGSLAACRHIALAPINRLFAFSLGGEGAKRLGDAAEAYVMAQLERGFHTLDFYKGLAV